MKLMILFCLLWLSAGLLFLAEYDNKAPDGYCKELPKWARIVRIMIWKYHKKLKKAIQDYRHKIERSF